MTEEQRGLGEKDQVKTDSYLGRDPKVPSAIEFLISKRSSLLMDFIVKNVLENEM